MSMVVKAVQEKIDMPVVQGAQALQVVVGKNTITMGTRRMHVYIDSIKEEEEVEKQQIEVQSKGQIEEVGD